MCITVFYRNILYVNRYYDRYIKPDEAPGLLMKTVIKAVNMDTESH